MNYSRNETDSAEDMLVRELSNRSLPRKIAECSFAVALILTAFTGNFLVCLAIKRNRKLRTIPNYYITSLALTDILMSLCGMPLTLATLIADHWKFGVVLCQYQGYLGTVLGTSSLLTIALTAVNRYFKIVRAQEYSKYYTPKTALLSIAVSWGLALVVPVPYLAIGDRYRFHPGKAMCFFDLDNSNIFYAILTITCFAMLPFGVIALCYYKVYRTVRRHNSRLAQNAGAQKFTVDEVKLAKLLFAILLGFLLCWTPFVVIDVIGAIKGQFSLPREVYMLYTVAAGLSSCVNPIIYGVMNKDFRSEIKTMLTIKPCKISVTLKRNARAKYVVDSPKAKNKNNINSIQ